MDAVLLALMSTPCELLECVAIKVNSRLKSFIFATYYRPPSCPVKWQDLFEESLQYLLSLNLPLVISGNFNHNLLKDSPFADNIAANYGWKHIAANYGWKQIITEPTRIAKKSAKLLDHIYVSHQVGVYNQGTFCPHISEHIATYLHIQNVNSVSRQPLRNPASVYRSLKNLKQDQLLNDLSKVPWHITKI